jgi:hypothetical protein
LRSDPVGSGHNGVVMAGLLVLGFPFVLLGFMLFMGRVEEPLSRAATERKMEQFLEQADPVEIDTFVHQGTDSALRRFTARLRNRRRRSGRGNGA